MFQDLEQKEVIDRNQVGGQMQKDTEAGKQAEAEVRTGCTANTK